MITLGEGLEPIKEAPSRKESERVVAVFNSGSIANFTSGNKKRQYLERCLQNLSNVVPFSKQDPLEVKYAKDVTLPHLFLTIVFYYCRQLNKQLMKRNTTSVSLSTKTKQLLNPQINLKMKKKIQNTD